MKIPNSLILRLQAHFSWPLLIRKMQSLQGKRDKRPERVEDNTFTCWRFRVAPHFLLCAVIDPVHQTKNLMGVWGIQGNRYQLSKKDFGLENHKKVTHYLNKGTAKKSSREQPVFQSDPLLFKSCRSEHSVLLFNCALALSLALVFFVYFKSLKTEIMEITGIWGFSS